MKVFGSTKCNITKGEKGGNVSHLEINDVALAQCYIVNKEYQEDLRALHIFDPNKSSGQF